MLKLAKPSCVGVSTLWLLSCFQLLCCHPKRSRGWRPPPHTCPLPQPAGPKVPPGHHLPHSCVEERICSLSQLPRRLLWEIPRARAAVACVLTPSHGPDPAISHPALPSWCLLSTAQRSQEIFLRLRLCWASASRSGPWQGPAPKLCIGLHCLLKEMC